MKPLTKHTNFLHRNCRAPVLIGALAALAIMLACSSSAKPVATAVQPVRPGTPPSANTGQMLRTAQTVTTKPAVAAKTAAAGKSPAKPIVFRSRDYGVSFVYPWQYAYFSARAVATGDPALRPKSDQHHGQVTLVRIEVPPGFYPDTDFERGYFTLSLNQNVDEQECQATLDPSENKVQTETIHGVDYRWSEADSGGRGSASKVRNYVAFTNGTCYELELGVRTANRDGLAREVDPDQVLQRLHAILQTVEIMPSLRTPPQVATSNAAPPQQ